MKLKLWYMLMVISWLLINPNSLDNKGSCWIFIVNELSLKVDMKLVKCQTSLEVIQSDELIDSFELIENLDPISISF